MYDILKSLTTLDLTYFNLTGIFSSMLNSTVSLSLLLTSCVNDSRKVLRVKREEDRLKLEQTFW